MKRMEITSNGSKSLLTADLLVVQPQNMVSAEIIEPKTRRGKTNRIMRDHTKKQRHTVCIQPNKHTAVVSVS